MDFERLIALVGEDAQALQHLQTRVRMYAAMRERVLGQARLGSPQEPGLLALIESLDKALWEHLNAFETSQMNRALTSTADGLDHAIRYLAGGLQPLDQRQPEHELPRAN